MAGGVVTPLIGRDSELAALHDALNHAGQRTDRVVLVAGEAGIGKTRLVTEFVGRAEANGTVALWGACSDFEFALPFLPLNEAIGTYLAATDSALLRKQLGPLADAVAAIVPQLSNGEPAPDDLSQAGLRLRLFEGVVAVLREVALTAEAGAILVVDDVQWADASTRELLDFVVRRTRHLPVLVVVTYRSDEVGKAHPFRATLDGWRRAGLASMLKIRPLTSPEVGRLVCARLAADRVTQGLVHMLSHRAEGVPFAVEELLEAALGSGMVVERDGSWRCSALSKLDLPDSLAAGILRRLDRLDPEQRRVVIAAAILGPRFDPRVLPELTGLPAGAVSAGLDAAATAQLLERDPANSGRLRFRHALTHEAICQAVTEWEAAGLHSRAADVLSCTDSPATERVRHLLAAGRTAEAAPLCAEAARIAEGASAFAEAAALYEHALAGVDDPVERARLLHEQGRMEAAGGSPAAAVAPLREAIALAEDVAPAATPRFLATLANALWFAGEHQASFEAYQRARGRLEKVPPSPDLALVYAWLASWYLSDLGCAEALDLADRALALAEQLGAESARVPALLCRGGALGELGHRDEGIEVIDRGIAEAVRLMRVEDVAFGLAVSAVQRVFAMRAQELPPTADVLRAADMGPISEMFASFVEAVASRFLGDVGLAEAAALALLDGADSLGWDMAAFIGRELLAWVRLQQGRLGEAEALMEGLGPRGGTWHRLFGPSRVELAMARRDFAGAAEHARALLARVPTIGSAPFVAGVAVPALLAAGAQDEADACVAWALGTDRHPMAVGAAADLAAYRGDADGAAALYREAFAGASAAGYQLIARTYEARLGEVVELVAAGASVPAPSRGGLSPREQELLVLLAGGKTDEQIAQALFVSKRTVQSHLNRIRDKSGRRRRSELTLLAIELGLAHY